LANDIATSIEMTVLLFMSISCCEAGKSVAITSWLPRTGQLEDMPIQRQTLSGSERKPSRDKKMSALSRESVLSAVLNRCAVFGGGRTGSLLKQKMHLFGVQVVSAS
jgi:hypothetical protein